MCWENGQRQHRHILLNKACCNMRAVIAEVNGMAAIIGGNGDMEGVYGGRDSEESFAAQS